MASDRSRFEQVSRRAFLRRSATAGLAAAGAFGLVACGANDDASVFSNATDGTAPADTGAATTPADSGSSAPATVAGAPTTTKATGTSAGGSAASGPALPASAELRVAFTFTAGADTGGPGGDRGGRGGVKNPYIAVWIEDAAGRMVQTVSLWLQQGKGEKWWPDLTRWYGQDAKRVRAGGASTTTTITGATRTAGDYAVAWNGTDFDGQVVPQGAYFVCIEAAREHGPYELVRESVTLEAAGFDQALTPKGELTAAAVTYVV